MSEKSHKGFQSNEIEVNFDKTLTDQEWDELFKEARQAPKCDGSCAKDSGGRLYDGHNGKCNYCGFQK